MGKPRSDLGRVQDACTEQHAGPGPALHLEMSAGGQSVLRHGTHRVTTGWGQSIFVVGSGQKQPRKSHLTGWNSPSNELQKSFPFDLDFNIEDHRLLSCLESLSVIRAQVTESRNAVAGGSGAGKLYGKDVAAFCSLRWRLVGTNTQGAKASVEFLI